MGTNLNGNPYTREEDEIDLSTLFAQLWANKWLIVIITSICFAFGAFYSYRQVPQYQTDVLIQADESKSSMKSGDGINILGLPSHGNVAAIESALIQSRFILDPVVKSLGLNIKIKPKKSIWERVFSRSYPTAEVNLFQLPKDRFNEDFQLVYEDKENVTLYNKKGKKILAGKAGELLVSQDGRYRLQVKAIASSSRSRYILKKYPSSMIVSQLINHIKIEGMGDKRKDIGLFSISMVDSNPQQAVKILNEVAHITQEKNAEKKSQEASQTLSFLEKQLPLAKQALSDAELKLNKYRAESGKINIEWQAQTLLEQLSELDKKIVGLQINKIDMSQRYTQEHPALIALDRQIEETEKEKNRLEQRIRSLPESDQIALGLMREVEVKSVLYTNLLNRIQELEVVKAGTISDVRILSLAKLPDRPLPSKKKLIYLGSIFFGFMLSAGLIFLRRLVFPRVQDPHWIERHFNIPNLATIPFSKENKTTLQHTTALHNGQSTLLAQINPKNLSIESLRSLRTSIQINLSCAKNNIITILGIMPEVGKTFISTNLAYLLATAGKRVLLIDADLRRGTAHQYFGLEPGPGFSELIQNQVAVAEALKRTAHKNLTLLPRGLYPDDPSELLSSSRCKELIQAFSEQYDIVLFDTPPILLVTDAALISAIAGVNYLVVGANMHRPEDIEISIKRVFSAGAAITGSIFNYKNSSSEMKSPGYGQYYSYYADDVPENNKKNKITNKIQKILSRA